MSRINPGMLFLLFVPTLSACTTVPPLSGPASVPLIAVVERVKCDLARITAQKINSSPKIAFLKQWSIKAHLTLAVDNTASVNPGATLVQPLNNAMPLGGTIGAVSQSFSLGLGGGLISEATATTDLEFYLSFQEMETALKTGSYPSYCVRPDGILLDSDLRLDALFDNALEPVLRDKLTAGNHPGIAGSPPAQPTKKAIQILEEADSTVSRTGSNIPLNEVETLSPSQLKTMQGTLKSLSVSPMSEVQLKAIASARFQEDRLASFQGEARQREIQAQSIVKNIIEPVASIISDSYPVCSAEINQLKNKAIVQAAEISSDRIDVDVAHNQPDADRAIGRERTAGEALVKTKGVVMGLLHTCPKRPKVVPPSAQYDPIDLMSQTVNFYITASGSINPAWKLVRVTAPIAPAFATASRKYTDTLIVAFGRPDPGKAESTAVSNQILTATLRDALMSVQPR